MGLGIGIGIGIPRTSGEGVGETNPVLALLAKGTGGFWYGGLAAQYFQGTDESTPATVAGDVIGRANDRGRYLRNATQGSASLKPKLQFDAAKRVMRFDGTDDYLLTDQLPAPSMTFIVKQKVSLATRVSIGAADDSTAALGRTEFGVSSNGAVALGVGGFSINTFRGVTDTRGVLGVAAGTFDASSMWVYWQGVQEGTAARSGAAASIGAIAIGASNRLGTIALPTAGDLYELVCVVGYVATADEVAAVSAYFNA